jgi:hypothetical protein
MKYNGGIEGRSKGKFQGNLLRSAMTLNRNKREVLKGRNSKGRIISVFKLALLTYTTRKVLKVLLSLYEPFMRFLGLDVHLSLRVFITFCRRIMELLNLATV